MGWVDPWVGLGQLADGLGRIGSHKMDLWTTLPQIEWSHSPHGHIAQSDVKISLFSETEFRRLLTVQITDKNVISKNKK